MEKKGGEEKKALNRPPVTPCSSWRFLPSLSHSSCSALSTRQAAQRGICRRAATTTTTTTVPPQAAISLQREDSNPGSTPQRRRGFHPGGVLESQIELATGRGPISQPAATSLAEPRLDLFIYFPEGGTASPPTTSGEQQTAQAEKLSPAGSAAAAAPPPSSPALAGL